MQKAPLRSSCCVGVLRVVLLRGRAAGRGGGGGGGGGGGVLLVGSRSVLWSCGRRFVGVYFSLCIEQRFVGCKVLPGVHRAALPLTDFGGGVLPGLSLSVCV